MKKLRVFLFIIFLGFCFYIFSTQILRFSVKVNEAFITSHNIPNTFDGARIIQFSDLLIESNRDLRTLENAVNAINRLNPDIVVFTGNLFREDSYNSQLGAEVESLLIQIQSSLGKVAVLGSNDLTQAEEITELLNQSSFHVLRNDSFKFFNGTNEGISFLGIDSLATNPNLDSLLSTHTSHDMFNVLLINEPTLVSTTTSFPVEIQLSGYCRGVNLPLDNLDSSYCSQFHLGTYRFANQLFLNVNRGLNRPKHPLTLLSRPTIDSFLLIRE